MGRNKPGYTKEYYQKNKEKFNRGKGFKRLAYSANCLYKGNKLKPFDIWKIAKKQKCRCALTGEKLTLENMSLDHIISRSKGGLNIPSNVRLVLKSINIARQTMTDDEFITMCRKVVDNSVLLNNPPGTL